MILLLKLLTGARFASGRQSQTRGKSGGCHSSRTKLWTLHHLLSKPSTAASTDQHHSWVGAQEQGKAKDSFHLLRCRWCLGQMPPQDAAEIKPVCPKRALWMNYGIRTAWSRRQNQTSFRWELTGNTCRVTGMVVTVPGLIHRKSHHQYNTNIQKLRDLLELKHAIVGLFFLEKSRHWLLHQCWSVHIFIKFTVKISFKHPYY